MTATPAPSVHDRLQAALRHLSTWDREAFINEVADLAFSLPEGEADAFLEANPFWRAHRESAVRLYYEHIVAMETAEAARLLDMPTGPGRRYADLASPKGRISYERVADMFDQVDFQGCRHFVMVGCGQLPVTPLHVMERAGVTHMTLLDVSPKAVDVVGRLRDAFGWHALQPRLSSGKDFDYAGADIVYIGNMVSPKSLTLQRVLATAPADVRIVLREPYSFGRLWAEKAEVEFGGAVQVTGRGAVSRHLSRDLFLRRSGSRA